MGNKIDLAIIKNCDNANIKTYLNDWMDWVAEHGYDSDYWGYCLYDAGNEIDVFCTRPDWYSIDTSEEELRRYSGNSAMMAQYFNVSEDSIKNYFVTWTEENYDVKAYPEMSMGRKIGRYVILWRNWDIGIPETSRSVFPTQLMKEGVLLMMPAQRGMRPPKRPLP